MRPEGTVFKRVGGLFSVNTNRGMMECTIRRAIKEEVYVGDRVEIDSDSMTIEKLLPRKSLLYRPVVANADYVLIVFSAKDPSPSFLLLDRILVSAEEKNISPIICINKIDLGDVDLQRYERAGYPCLKVSAETLRGMDELEEILRGKVSVLAGPSGVGKSSITAILTGESVRISHVSKAANRGRHTTRHSEFFELSRGGILVDSPGFGAMDLSYIEKERLRDYFPEFQAVSECKFSNCSHNGEPGCAVMEALNLGRLSPERYSSYIKILEEIPDNRKTGRLRIER